jgi:hypothetical protein
MVLLLMMLTVAVLCAERCIYTPTFNHSHYDITSRNLVAQGCQFPKRRLPWLWHSHILCTKVGGLMLA